jgi:hypothetical protein
LNSTGVKLCRLCRLCRLCIKDSILLFFGITIQLIQAALTCFVLTLEFVGAEAVAVCEISQQIPMVMRVHPDRPSLGMEVALEVLTLSLEFMQVCV